MLASSLMASGKRVPMCVPTCLLVIEGTMGDPSAAVRDKFVMALI